MNSVPRPGRRKSATWFWKKSCRPPQWEAWQQAGGDVHSIVADPMFVDAEHGDFRLKPESPALKQGFEPIPFDKIGPYEDDARATWPIEEAEGVREHPEWLQSASIND